MIRLKNASISSRLTWMNMIVSGVALLLACTAFLIYDRVSVRESMTRNLAAQAEIIGTNSVSALDFDDARSAESTMSALKGSPQITGAVIYTKEKKAFAAYSRDHGVALDIVPEIPEGQTETHVFENDRLIVGRPILFQGKTAGFVFIQSDLSELNDRLKRYAGIVVAILAVSLLAAYAISFISKRAISQPASELAEVARIVSRDKNYSLRATPLRSKTELAELIDAFNDMLAEIQSRDAELEQGRAELEKRVEMRTSELAAVNKELEAFSYSVSHDLRAPIRHIDGFSMLLNQKYGSKMEPNALQYLNRIRDSAKHMGQLIDDLLGMARINRQEAVRRRVEISDLVAETIRSLQHDSDGRQIEWRTGELPQVECDPNLMRIVLTNLLNNAVKYTRNCEKTVIETGCLVQDHETVFFIRDNGAGFEQEYAHKLFGVFQRLHRPEDFEGTGVGLATVQRIIQKHGGRIWAEGKVNEGATFFFTLGAA
jgi:signal transduction histidine kinase